MDAAPTRDWAFDGATGEGVRVALVDSGVDESHAAVAGPFAPGVSMSWDRDEDRISIMDGPHEDLFGHGTACAGVIRAIAPLCEITSVRVLGPRASGKGEVFAAGLRWAIRSGARVVNLSLSTAKPELFALFHEIADEAHHAGVVLVGAMNNVPAPTYPAEYASVISVAATEKSEDPLPLLCGASPPADFGAPGIDVEVAWTNGTSMIMTGNSFAAPYVTGLVALLLSKHPHLRPYEVKSVLRAVAGNARATAAP
ncbi:MAG TPA: S8 family serine peptidase [Mycobacteriales bacterium]|nr:S8 family serine peptidase [Mycobacteriales bacterium]